MDICGPPLLISQKTAYQQPCTCGIIDHDRNRIKYARSSTDSGYQKKDNEDTTTPDAKRTKFTVIGDRVTKEFIYCSNVVMDFYKHRKKMFEAPVIRGVTTIEWPMVWNDLKIKYKAAHCQTSSVAVLINNKFLGGETELKKCVISKFRYTIHPNYHKESIVEFARFFRGSGRPFAYMNIEMDEKPIGSFIFMLYADIVPHTCDNFLRLCKETKGGYAGTPIHRVVKDGWIQAGGFGLKETDLACENFIIPHDRRGVLCMANAGLNTECSTQFFVLLQPAPWMKNKFVAFGQLVEGKNTLETIEAVQTWHESPVSNISIFKSGILNIHCDSIMINKGINEYINMHIEDLNELGALLCEELLDKVYILAHLRDLGRLRQEDEEEEESKGDMYAGLHTTARFNRRKEDIDMVIQKSNVEKPMTVIFSKQAAYQRPASVSVTENNDFDVESYEPEHEETDYQHQSIQEASNPVLNERKPFYIPLTDVLYPGEKDSEFDLKRFLQGDYCLECDLIKPAKKCLLYKGKMSSYSSECFHVGDMRLDSDKNVNTGEEVTNYLRSNMHQLSFAGGIVEDISKCKGNLNIFDQVRQCPLTDDELRRLRLASIDMRYRDKADQDKKVSIRLPEPFDKEHRTKIKRRATGFVHLEGNTNISIFNKISNMQDDKDVDYSDSDTDDDTDVRFRDRKVRIISATSKEGMPVHRELTTFALATVSDDDDDKVEGDAYDTRHSVLARLFDEMKDDGEAPTLKEYRPMSETPSKKYRLLSTGYRFENDVESEKYQPKTDVENDSFEQVLRMQHGKALIRKISSDYAKTIGDIEHKIKYSIRSVEYAKTRPAITVSQYQQKNRIYGDAKRSKVDLFYTE